MGGGETRGGHQVKDRSVPAGSAQSADDHGQLHLMGPGVG